MADVTINQLTSQAPTTNDLFPFSTPGVTPSTYKASLAQIKTALAIPTAVSQLTNDSAYITASSLPATQQLAKAWVNFDGTGAIGTNQTIRSSYNVASVYKGNTGSYRITFTTAQANNNYCVTGATAPAYSAYWTSLALHTAAPSNGGTESAPTNAYFDVCVVMQTTGKVDSKYVSIVVL